MKNFRPAILSGLLGAILVATPAPAPAQLFGKKKTDEAGGTSAPAEAPRVEVDSLAEIFPAGALAFGETAALGDLLSYVRGEALLDLFLKSEEFGNIRETEDFKKADATRKLLELVLRMSLWEAGARLLGGEVGLALYPHLPGKDPHIVALIRPSESSAWLKTRILLAPLVRIGLKRVERFIGNDVVIFRTRGDKDEATYVSFHDRWIAVASDLDLLKQTIGLQIPSDPAKKPDPVAVLSDGAAYRRMTAKMGLEHLARFFIDTRRVPEAGGDRLWVGDEDAQDPLVALYLGGTMELLGKSQFAGVTLDKRDNVIEVRSTIDARAEDLDAKHRVLFTGGKGRVERLPELPGMLGGFSMQRQVSDWYGRRGEALLRDAEVPGAERFAGVLEKLMKGSEKPLLGDRFLFVSAQAEDGGVSGLTSGRLPGFAVQAELADAVGADGALDELFPLMLAEIFSATERNWRRDDQEGPGSEAEAEKAAVESDWVIEESVVEGRKTRTATSVTHPGMRPAAVCVGDAMILSTSTELCRQLASRQGGERVWEEDKDFVFSLRFDELSKFLKANEAAYKATIVREGDTERTAEEAMKGLAMLLSRMKSISGSTSAASGSLELVVRGELR